MLPASRSLRMLCLSRCLSRDGHLWRPVQVCANRILARNVRLFTTEQTSFQESVPSATENLQPNVKPTLGGVGGSESSEKHNYDTINNIYAILKSKDKIHLENILRKCDNVTEVLDQLREVQMQPIHAYIVLERLCQLQKSGHDVVKADLVQALQGPMFGKVTKVLHKQATHLPPSFLIGCTRFLVILTPEDIYIIKSLETQLLWLMRKFPMSLMVRILELHSVHQETDLRKQVYREALTQVERRWVEISNPRDLVTLLYLTLNNSPKLTDKLEERALDLAEHMAPKDLYKVAYLLAKKRRRNTPLLRALVYHMNKSKLSLSAVQLMNLLYACSTLNVHDENLLSKISTALTQRNNLVSLSTEPFVLSSILLSFGNLRWQNVIVIDSLLELVLKNVDQYKLKELATVPITSAKVNYVSPSLRLALPSITEKLSPLRNDDPILWLDIVWSMAILNLLTERQAASVLNPAFFIQLPSGDAFKMLACHIKLLNVAAAAKYDVDGYSGPVLPENADANGAQALCKGDKALAHSVISALSNMAPLGKFMRTDIVTASGYFLDADLFVNHSGQPVPYDDFCDKDTAGVFRIALRVLDFNDLTLDTKVPVGLHAMAARHLTAAGYTVVQVPYTEFDEKATVVQKVQYLQQKINMTVGSGTSPASSSGES